MVDKTYRVDNAQLTVCLGTSISDVVNVETRVLVQSGCVCVVEHVTGIILGIKIRIGQNLEFSLGRRESTILLQILVKATVLMSPAEGIHCRLVKIEQLVPVLDKRENNGLLLQSCITNDRIIDSYTAELVVIVIISSDERIGDVRNVEACIGFSSDVCCETLHVKGVDEVFPEAGELETEFYFVCDVGLALGVAYSDRLFDPDDVGSEMLVEMFWVAGFGDLQVCPAVGVWHRGESTLLPQERSILSQKTTERTTSRTTVQPTKSAKSLPLDHLTYQMSTSSEALTLVLGKNQKNNSLSSSGSCEMGKSPA